MHLPNFRMGLASDLAYINIAANTASRHTAGIISPSCRGEMTSAGSVENPNEITGRMVHLEDSLEISLSKIERERLMYKIKFLP